MEVENNSENLAEFAAKSLILLEGTIEVSPVEDLIISKEDWEDFVKRASKCEQVLLESLANLVHGGSVLKDPWAKAVCQLIEVASLIKSVTNLEDGGRAHEQATDVASREKIF